MAFGGGKIAVHAGADNPCMFNQSINQSIKPLTVNDQWLTINIKMG